MRLMATDGALPKRSLAPTMSDFESQRTNLVAAANAVDDPGCVKTRARQIRPENHSIARATGAGFALLSKNPA
jgi:hypothetical protein